MQKKAEAISPLPLVSLTVCLALIALHKCESYYVQKKVSFKHRNAHDSDVYDFGLYSLYYCCWSISNVLYALTIFYF